MSYDKPLYAYTQALASAVGVSDEVACGQMFKPTGYPQKVVVTPGALLVRPGSYDYAPDIAVAEQKIRAKTAAARANKVAVLDISIEPGSGKTLHLPKRFAPSRVLVVLPTVFDAWIAWSASPDTTNIVLYGHDQSGKHHVTYTDSYHAAYLMASGAICSYSVVMIDESDSAAGVTPFVASVARPGIIIVRMTASPPSVNAAPRKSFPIVVERDVPDHRDLDRAARYVGSRAESRVLVLCPDADYADQLIMRMDDAVLLSSKIRVKALCQRATDVTGPAVYVADAVPGRGANLNVDCVVDFGVITQSGVERAITASEQLQRKARTGRLRPGVYCCSVEALPRRVRDEYSVFRSNLWLKTMSMRPNSCGFDLPEMKSIPALLACFTAEPADALELALDDPVAAESYASSDFDSVTSGGGSRTGPIYCDLQADSDEESLPGIGGLDIRDRDPTEPSWYDFYVKPVNHPSVYTADLVFDHRGIAVAGVQLDRSFTVTQAPNRALTPSADGESPRHRDSRSFVDSRPPGAAGRVFGSITRTGTVTRDGSVTRSIAASTDQHSRGTTSHDTRAYQPMGPLRRRGTTVNGVFEVDDPLLAGPVVLLRSTKVSRQSRATAYKTASVCAGYFVVHGLVLASGDDLHRGLVPMLGEARQALHESTTAGNTVAANYYLTYTVVAPVRSLHVEDKRASLFAAGAWSIPSCSELPVVDLNSSYHEDWEDVLSTLIRRKQPFPRFAPRVNYYGQVRYRVGGRSTVREALDFCESPSYDPSELMLVVSAWNLLSVESCVVGKVDVRLYRDAEALLVYLSCADKLTPAEPVATGRSTRYRAQYR